MTKKRLVSLLLLLLPHCGYTLRHRLKETFNHPKGIFVPVFDNNSTETGAEQIFTNALLRELMSRNETVVASRKEAGLELRGTINDIQMNVTSHTLFGDISGLQEYSRLPAEVGVKIILWVGLYDIPSGKALWGKTFDGFRRVNTLTTSPRTFDFQAPSSVALNTQSIIRSIYPDIARTIMRDVYDDMVEWF